MLSKDNVILGFILFVLGTTLFYAMNGNDFAREVFQQTWVTLPTYLGAKKVGG